MSEVKNENIIDVAADFIDDEQIGTESTIVEGVSEFTEIKKVEESEESLETAESSQNDDEEVVTEDGVEKNEDNEISEKPIDPQGKKEKQNKPQKKGPKVTRTDIIEAFKEKEELKMRATNEREEQALKWHIVQDYLHTKKIARGTVISVEETTSGMVIAVVNFNDFRVIIPASEFFIKPIAVEAGVNEQSRIRREKQVIVKSLGAEVEFVIAHAKQEKSKDAKDKEYVVLASRKQALLRQIKYYFGKKGDTRRVETGRIIRNAPVIAVGKEALMVTVCGVDKILTKAQLSYKFLGTLVNTFHVGDRIDIAVLDVVDKEDGNIELKVSHKQTQLEQFKRNVSNCSVGGMYRGIITIVRDNTVQLYLSDVDVPAFSKIIKLNNIEDLPSAGDTVLLVANKIIPERGLVLGTIIRLIKK